MQNNYNQFVTFSLNKKITLKSSPDLISNSKKINNIINIKNYSIQQKLSTKLQFLKKQKRLSKNILTNSNQVYK